MRLSLWILLTAIAGLAVGVGRAYLESGGFDPSRVLAGTEFRPAAGADYWQAPAGRRAKAALAETELKFGKLEIGRTQKHSFTVKNDGDWPLVLAAQETSCVCTIADLPQRPIEPGQSAMIALAFSAPAEALAGEPYRQWASIATNDPEQPVVRLVVEGTLVASLAADVAELSFGRVAASQTKTASFRLHSFRTGHGAPLAVTHEFEAAAGAEFFAATAQALPAAELASVGAAAGWQIDVTVKPGLPRGPFLQTIRFAPAVIVPIVGEIGPDMFVVGPGYSERSGILEIKQAKAGTTTRRRLTLVIFGDHENRSGPEIDVSGLLSAKLADARFADDGSQRWPLEVEVSADAEEAAVVADDAREVFGCIFISASYHFRSDRPNAKPNGEHLNIPVHYEAK